MKIARETQFPCQTFDQEEEASSNSLLPAPTSKPILTRSASFFALVARLTVVPLSQMASVPCSLRLPGQGQTETGSHSSDGTASAFARRFHKPACPPQTPVNWPPLAPPSGRFLLRPLHGESCAGAPIRPDRRRHRRRPDPMAVGPPHHRQGRIGSNSGHPGTVARTRSITCAFNFSSRTLAVRAFGTLLAIRACRTTPRRRMPLCRQARRQYRAGYRRWP